MEMVERWLAWYAVKHNYGQVLQALASRPHPPTLPQLGVPPSALCLSVLREIVGRREVQHYGRAVDIVVALRDALREGGQGPGETTGDIDEELVERITAGLKCKILFRCVEENQPNVLSQLNTYFPASQQSASNQTPASHSHLPSAQFRTFFLSLLANPAHRRAYLTERYPREFGRRFEEKLDELIGRFLGELHDRIPAPPGLDKLLSAGPGSVCASRLDESQQAAVEILLDAVSDATTHPDGTSAAPGLTQQQCLSVLSQLRPTPGTGIQLNQTMSDWFESQRPRPSSSHHPAPTARNKRPRSSSSGNKNDDTSTKRCRTEPRQTDGPSDENLHPADDSSFDLELGDLPSVDTPSHLRVNLPASRQALLGTADSNVQSPDAQLASDIYKGRVYRMKARPRLRTVQSQDCMAPAPVRTDQPPGPRDSATSRPTIHAPASRDPAAHQDSGRILTTLRTHQSEYLAFLQQNGVSLQTTHTMESRDPAEESSTPDQVHIVSSSESPGTSRALESSAEPQTQQEGIELSAEPSTQVSASSPDPKLEPTVSDEPKTDSEPNDDFHGSQLSIEPFENYVASVKQSQVACGLKHVEICINKRLSRMAETRQHKPVHRDEQDRRTRNAISDEVARKAKIIDSKVRKPQRDTADDDLQNAKVVDDDVRKDKRNIVDSKVRKAQRDSADDDLQNVDDNVRKAKRNIFEDVQRAIRDIPDDGVRSVTSQPWTQASCSLECDEISIVSGSQDSEEGLDDTQYSMVIPSSRSLDRFDAVCLGSQSISRQTLPPIHRHLNTQRGKLCVVKLFTNKSLQREHHLSVKLYS